jgi:hypothetical protein
MHAYFHAQGISVLAGYPCYHWVLREDDENASTTAFDPAGYFGNVREVLDLIDGHMEPGPLRDRVRSHWYRGKMLGRVGGRNFLEREPGYRRELYEEIRRLALERYGDEVEAYLAFNARVRSRLLRDGRYEALEALAAFEAGLRAEPTVVELEPDEQGIALTIEARLVGDDGPLAFVRRGERLEWSPPGELAEALPPEALGATEEQRAYADVLLWSMRDGTEFLLPTESEVRYEPLGGVEDRVTPVLVARARVEPRVASAKAKLRPGEWTAGVTAAFSGFTPPSVAVERGGWARRAPLVITVARDGRVLPPRLRGDVAKRFPRVARAVQRARGGRAASTA